MLLVVALCSRSDVCPVISCVEIDDGACAFIAAVLQLLLFMHARVCVVLEDIRWWQTRERYHNVLVTHVASWAEEGRGIDGAGDAGARMQTAVVFACQCTTHPCTPCVFL